MDRDDYADNEDEDEETQESEVRHNATIGHGLESGDLTESIP